jgi:osmoprotectant transport system permease protein
MLLSEILPALLEHLWLVGISVAAAIVISAPVAVLLTSRARLRRWTLGVVNVIQTIPSLALFGFLIPIPFIGGVGKRTTIIALILYALLPILRNAVVGIMGVDAGVRESALAMGMTRRQILLRVELPLAFPTILAGVRIATVATIGTATIAAAIGGGIPAALMAIAADEVLGWLERRICFWA